MVGKTIPRLFWWYCTGVSHASSPADTHSLTHRHLTIPAQTQAKKKAEEDAAAEAAASGAGGQEKTKNRGSSNGAESGAAGDLGVAWRE